MSRVLALLPQSARDFNFQKGMIFGMQSQELTDTPCMEALSVMQTTWVASSYQLDFVQYASTVLNKGNTPTDFGFAISLWEFMSDVVLIFFNFYTECQFELMLINLGSFTSKTSSAFNFSNSVGYMMYQWYIYKFSDSNAASPIKNLEDSTANFVYDSATDDEKYQFGRYLGAVVKQIFSFQIPVYQVNAFDSVE